MTKRIFRSIFLVAMVVLLASIALIMSVLYNYFSDQFVKELKNELHYIVQGWENSGADYLTSLTYAADRARITWIGADGTVLYDSVTEADEMENHSDREEFQAALKTGEGESSRYSSTLTQKTVNVARKVSDGSVLRVSSSRYSILTLLIALLQPILWVLVIAMIGSLLLAYRVSKRVTDPLNKLDLTHPENVDTYEELTPMLERMAYQNRRISQQIEELRRRQEEFTAITENMSEGLLVIDRNAELLSYNQSAMKLLGAGKIGEKSNVLMINRSEGFRQAVDGVLQGRHSEQTMAHADRVYQVIANPVRDRDKTAGAVLMILDITEKEEREKLRREFTANVSHELKTPLTSISGFAEMIRLGIAKPQDVGHFADKIYSESQRLIGLVGDIIKLSQLDENTVPQQWEMVDLSVLTTGIAERLKSAADQRKITVECSLPPVSVYGVRPILDEMIYNLAENAIKYNKEGGKVFLTLQKEENKVRLTVKDTGIGIPEADRERVFERFYRVDKSHSKEIGGTGLGLSIVKHGAAFHEATVELQSKLGQGTSVSLLFNENKFSNEIRRENIG